MIKILCQDLYLFTYNKQLSFVALGEYLGITALEQKLRSGNADINLKQLDQWVRWLRKELGITYIGLQVAYFTDLSRAGVIGHLLQAGKNIREVTRLSLEWVTADNPFFLDIKIKETADLVTFEFAAESPLVQYPTLIEEFMNLNLASTHLNQNKLIGGERIPLTQVTFATPAPVDVSYYEKVFKLTPVFDAPCYALSFPVKWYDMPVISYNKELFELLSVHVFAEIKKMQATRKFSEIVKEDIITAFRALRDITIDDIAEIHSLSVRSVQRNLKEESASFRQLYDLAKKELALSLLKSKNSQVTEVAYLLGYTGASAFTKAFKRWTGVSPKVYKNKNA